MTGDNNAHVDYLNISHSFVVFYCIFNFSYVSLPINEKFYA